MAQVDVSVAGTPGLEGLLQDLSRMALAHAPALDTWAVPNIMWSLAILHANPLGEGHVCWLVMGAVAAACADSFHAADGALVRALLARTLELGRAGTHLNPMGAAHIYWACATLRVCLLCLLLSLPEMPPAAEQGCSCCPADKNR